MHDGGLVHGSNASFVTVRHVSRVPRLTLVPQCQNHHLSRINPINDAVWTVQQLPVRRMADLRDHATTLFQSIQVRDVIQ